MKQFRFSLTFSILASLACLLVLTWLLLSLISFKTAEKDILMQKNEEARILLAAFVEILPRKFDTLPTDVTIGNFASRLAREKDFAGIYVIGATGTPVYVLNDRRGTDLMLKNTVRTGKESFIYSHDGRYVSRYAPIMAGDAVIGAARLSLSLSKEHERLKESRRLFLLYFVLDFLLLLGFGSFMLSRIIVVPLRKLISATAKIASGDYRHAVKVPGGAEIAELAESFNIMAEGLEQKRLEVERTVSSLEEANRKLQLAREETVRSEKMASVGLLAAGMAHEVGTPLAAIIGYAGILKDELQDDPDKADYLRRIEAEAARIDRIVRGLLDYARPTKANFEPVDIACLVSDTVDLLQGQGVIKHLALSLILPEGMPLVSLDPHQLQQVLINLVINARDAMPAGGSLEIKAEMVHDEQQTFSQAEQGRTIVGRRKTDHVFASGSVEQKGNNRWLSLSFADNGEGIAAEDLQRVFDPFFTTKEPGKGTGLGLAISARIIDSFGGRIVAASEIGKGTVMTILLPAVKEKE